MIGPSEQSLQKSLAAIVQLVKVLMFQPINIQRFTRMLQTFAIVFQEVSWLFGGGGVLCSRDPTALHVLRKCCRFYLKANPNSTISGHSSSSSVRLNYSSRLYNCRPSFSLPGINIRGFWNI